MSMTDQEAADRMAGVRLYLTMNGKPLPDDIACAFDMADAALRDRIPRVLSLEEVESYYSTKREAIPVWYEHKTCPSQSKWIILNSFEANAIASSWYGCVWRCRNSMSLSVSANTRKPCNRNTKKPCVWNMIGG